MKKFIQKYKIKIIKFYFKKNNLKKQMNFNKYLIIVLIKYMIIF